MHLEVLTCCEGYYEFNNLNPGYYTITFEKADYVTRVMDVLLVEGNNELGIPLVPTVVPPAGYSIKGVLWPDAIEGEGAPVEWYCITGYGNYPPIPVDGQFYRSIDLPCEFDNGRVNFQGTPNSIPAIVATSVFIAILNSFNFSVRARPLRQILKTTPTIAAMATSRVKASVSVISCYLPIASTSRKRFKGY